MKMKKALFSAVAVLCALVVFAGCSLFGGKPKTFEKAGMSITLTTSFHEKDVISQTAYYESTKVAVAALKEGFGSVSGMSGWTLQKYGQQVMKNNGLTADLSAREGKDYLWFDYEKSASGNDFYYIATVHKAGDAFWLVQFWCFQSQKDKYADVMLGYADTIVFTGSGSSSDGML